LTAPETSPTSELSEREREILRLVATGASNKEIAQRLYISPNTVKVHLRNIFAKIGVASRTEAALYAIRQGLAPVPREVLAGVEGNHRADGDAPGAGAEQPALRSDLRVLPHERLRQRPWRTLLWIMTPVALFVGLGVLVNGLRPQPPQPTPPPATPLPRWQAQADIPTARSGLAAAVYENQIYAIGGETTQGVTAIVEQYDPASGTWATLAPKPLAVTDVSAAVIGGWIYVPGGRTASGAVTDVLEAYDPRGNRWEPRASLPVALGAYALAAFEGRLYLFGGWDGHRYVASVYAYDPSRDQWAKQTPLPTARGYAGAAVAGGRIYVIGGVTEGAVLSVNEEYVPESDTAEGNPWTQRTPLPEGRWAMGIVSIADIIYVMGGDENAQPLPLLEYFPQKDQWQSTSVFTAQPWSRLGLTVVGTELHALGGQLNTIPTAQHRAYQAIYTILIPVVAP
jgi:DNA-binding CsgD family transcriptional regulator